MTMTKEQFRAMVQAIMDSSDSKEEEKQEKQDEKK
jgi:hypothetical protein